MRKRITNRSGRERWGEGQGSERGEGETERERQKKVENGIE